MDANGKPSMSRELLQRLMAVTPPTVSATHADNAVTGSAAQPQSFAERKLLERQRRHIGSYQRSALGVQNYKEEIGAASMASGRLVAPPTSGSQHVETGQNRPSAGFQEPPSRGYDPYA